MILTGKVKTGLGEASFWMKKAQDAFYNKTGIKMFPGTLNVELKEDYNLEGNLKVLKSKEYGGNQDVYIKECKIFGHKAYIVRTDKNISKERTHPLNLVEIISDINFRERYNLKDDQTIEIIYR